VNGLDEGGVLITEGGGASGYLVTETMNPHLQERETTAADSAVHSLAHSQAANEAASTKPARRGKIGRGLVLEYVHSARLQTGPIHTS
jgi:hypothetical protein